MRWRALLVGAAVAWCGGVSSAIAEEPSPSRWLMELRMGSGADSNPLRAPNASSRGGILRIAGKLELETPREIRLRAVGWFEQSLGEDGNQGELQVVGAYRRKLRPSLHGKVVSLSALRRDLSVFADGKVLTDGAIALSELSQHLFAGAEYAHRKFDFDGGLQTNVNFSTGSLERYFLFGISAAAGVRYIPTSRLAVRFRYSYELQNVDGLTPRNLAGASVRADPDLEIGVHNLRFSGRYRLTPKVALAAGYDYARITDGYNGYYDGGAHQFRVLGAIAPIRRWRGELSAEALHRSFPKRQASLLNQTSDSGINVVAEAERQLRRRLGLFFRYNFEHTWSQPFGLLYSRHVLMVGVSGQVGAVVRQ